MNASSEPGIPKFEMPSLPPRPGEVWLSVNLSMLEGMNIKDVLIQLMELGYSPELRFKQTGSQLTVYALLKHEVMEIVPDDYLLDEFESLAQWLPPDSINSPRSKRRQAIKAA